jgi:hypothetical protein
VGITLGVSKGVELSAGDGLRAVAAAVRVVDRFLVADGRDLAGGFKRDLLGRVLRLLGEVHNGSSIGGGLGFQFGHASLSRDEGGFGFLPAGRRFLERVLRDLQFSG